MLEGLDKVDWSRLSHAYGEAGNVPDLIRAVLSDDPELRDRALQELFSTIWHQGTVYSATAHAVPFLVELLAAPGVAEKESIFSLLSCIAEGHSYTDVHAALFDPMGAASPEEQRERASALSQELEWVQAARQAVEAGVETYLDLLADEDPEVQISAISMLSLCQSRAAWVIPELVARIPAQADPKRRAALILAVGDLAGAAVEPGRWIPLFAERMRPEEDPVVRLAAAVCLARSSPGEPAAVLDTLCETVSVAWGDFEDIEGDPAGRVSEALGGDPVARWRVLSAALDSRDERARSGARFAAERLCHERRSITPVIAAALGERIPSADPEERCSLVLKLYGLGTAAAAAAGPLATALDDDDPRVRTWAAMAMAGLGDPLAIPVIIERLRAGHAFPLRTREVGKLGAEARAMVPALLEALRGPPLETELVVNPRRVIALALGQIGSDARSAIPALIPLMEEGPLEQENAAMAIGQIGGPEARAAIPFLEILLRSPDEMTQIRAAQALWRIDGRTQPALDMLRTSLRGQCPAPAAEVLGEMGEAAQSAVPALVATLGDTSPFAHGVRLEAAIALWRIEHRTDRSLPVLIGLFRDPDAGALVATRAAEALGEMGADAREAVPPLREAAAADVRPFHHPFQYSSEFVIEDEALRSAVAQALRRIEGDLSPAGRSVR